MKEKRTVVKILIIAIMLLFGIADNVYAEDTTATKMQIIKAGDAWTNVSISDSYTECESLNALESTLGTKALQAHLTTDYDWSAMAILSISQYGATTANGLGNTSTTKNSSGIYAIGNKKTQTTTLINTFTSTVAPFDKLYDENGKLKKYINLIDPTTGIEYNSDKTATGRTAISYASISNGGTSEWFGTYGQIGQSTGYSVAIKVGLFGVLWGKGDAGIGTDANGRACLTATFRPVIWN